MFDEKRATSWVRSTSGRSRCGRGALSLAALLLVSFAGRVASAQVWFAETFDANPPDYGFGYTYPEGANYVLSHLPDGGYDGSGAAHIRTLAGHGQYGLGWCTPDLGQSPSLGDAVYIRFRIRYDDDHTWVGTGANENKFILMGNTGVTPNSRVIVHSHAPAETTGCTLGFTDYEQRPPEVLWQPEDFGLPYRSWDAPRIDNLYGSLAPHVNISWDCAGPMLVTRSEWYHVQVYARSGASGDAEFKAWLNNGNPDAPTVELVGGFDLGVDGWPELCIGGYQTGEPAFDGGFRLDGLEIGAAFDAGWFPGGSSGGGGSGGAGSGGVGVGGGSGVGAGAGTGTSAGGSGPGATTGGGGDAPAANGVDGASGDGCGCHVGTESSPVWGAAALGIAAIASAARRRRRTALTG
jgi:MYXO-CTERM domain-containing protein